MIKSVAIVGAGVSGCFAARRLADSGIKVSLFEKSEKVGGLCEDSLEGSTYIQKHGPHFFHTDDESLWNYVSSMVPMVPYKHYVTAYCSGKYVPVPVNKLTLSILKCSAFTAMKKIVVQYTRKMWYPYQDVDMVKARLEGFKLRDNFDCRYFGDEFEGIPKAGYTDMLMRIIDHENIKLECNTFMNDIYWLAKEYTIVLYCGRLDELFAYREGDLIFRTMIHGLHKDVTNEADLCPTIVCNYPYLQRPYIRRTNFSKLSIFLGKFDASKTVYLFEHPRDCSHTDYPMYPIHKSREDNDEVFLTYKAMLPQNVFPLGRVAEMKYYDIDDAMLAGWRMADEIIQA